MEGSNQAVKTTLLEGFPMQSCDFTQKMLGTSRIGPEVCIYKLVRSCDYETSEKQGRVISIV